jgi:hypothetical protein
VRASSAVELLAQGGQRGRTKDTDTNETAEFLHRLLTFFAPNSVFGGLRQLPGGNGCTVAALQSLSVLVESSGKQL